MAPPATDGSGAGGAGLQATGLKILYVEDDARSAAELVELAEANGDTVIWEATGSGGLLRAGRDEFDVAEFRPDEGPRPRRTHTAGPP